MHYSFIYHCFMFENAYCASIRLSQIDLLSDASIVDKVNIDRQLILDFWTHHKKMAYKRDVVIQFFRLRKKKCFTTTHLYSIPCDQNSGIKIFLKKTKIDPLKLIGSVVKTDPCSLNIHLMKIDKIKKHVLQRYR